MAMRPRLGITGRIVAVVAVAATLAALLMWWATAQGLSPLYALPVSIGAPLLLALFVSNDIAEPLKEATRAAKAMARGDYSVRVAASTSDEVGQLAEAFNSMAQDLAEVDQLHRDIVANVSHELRTPVAALRARLENMADGVEEPSRENLDAAVRQSEHLTELLQYLLDLSRLDAGVAGLDVREVGVADLLDSAIDVARLAALQNGRGVNFSTHIDPVDLRIHGDPARLMQVLVNVLDNATRHTPDGSTVHVDAGRQRSQARIDISDAGPGIAIEDRERVFGRFQRATPASAPATGGTGIGLAIARWAVAIHGGTIGVVDSDVGATFRILLPIAGPAAGHSRRGAPVRS